MKKIELGLVTVSIILSLLKIIFINEELDFLFIVSLSILALFYLIISPALLFNIPLRDIFQIDRYRRRTKIMLAGMIFLSIGLVISILSVVWVKMAFQFYIYFQIASVIFLVALAITVSYKLYQTNDRRYLRILKRVLIISFIVTLLWIIPSVNIGSVQSISLEKWESISLIIYNILFPISLVVAGLWTLNVYYKRKEPAAIKIRIDKIELLYDKGSNSKYLDVQGLVSNIGSRDLSLNYKKTFLKVSKINSDPDDYTLISTKNGLTSHNIHNQGRIRSKVEYNLPYLVKIEEPGIYFLELIVQVKMMDFYKHPFAKDSNQIDWSDRKFYQVE